MVAQQTLTLYVEVRILLPLPDVASEYRGYHFRGVAQFGRALRSGRRSRRFKSSHLDQNTGFCAVCAEIRCFFYSKKKRALQKNRADTILIKETYEPENVVEDKKINFG